MYQTHQPIISGWAQAHPDNLARVIQFAILSARVQFSRMPYVIEHAARGESGDGFYGYKVRAYAEAWHRREAHHWHLLDIWSNPWDCRRERANQVLDYLCGNVYGLSTVKAGFVAQMVFGVSGCLDSVNTQRLELPTRYARICPTTTPPARRRLIQKYNGMIYRLGGPRKLWDDWCAVIARKYPATFRNAHDASAYHLECLGLTVSPI